ncbi:MAG TPA: rod shape-determining protein MreD [Vicinamibacteria bacterium]
MTLVGLLAALLMQSGLSLVAPGHARIVDPFLLVLVYCALTWGENYAMLAGAAAGWVQDAQFGGPIIGLSGLTKVLVGFGVGLGGSRFHLSDPGGRAAALVAATLLDAFIFQQLAAAFEVRTYELTVGTLLVRCVVNAGLGVMLYSLADRRFPVEGRP